LQAKATLMRSLGHDASELHDKIINEFETIYINKFDKIIFENPMAVSLTFTLNFSVIQYATNDHVPEVFECLLDAAQFKVGSQELGHWAPLYSSNGRR
jgi:hypothetical protein